MSKVLICGGRSYEDAEFFYKTMKVIDDEIAISSIVHGDAKGADTMAKTLANYIGVKEIPYPADWDNLSVPGALVKERRNGKKYNVLAGPMRNQKMLDENPDIKLVVVFPGGAGTKDMMLRAQKAGFKVRIIEEVK